MSRTVNSMFIPVSANSGTLYSHCITFTSLPRGIHSPFVGAWARKLLASSFPGSAGIQSSGFSSCSCNTNRSLSPILTICLYLKKATCNLLLTLSCLLLRTRYLNKSRWRFLIAAWERLKMVSMLPKTLKQKITTWSCCPSLIADKLDQLENGCQLRRIYNSCTSLRD